MVKSLARKAGLLAATIVLVLWIGWPIPHDPIPVKTALRGEPGRQEAAPLHDPTPVSPPLPRRSEAAPPVDRTKISQGKLDLNRATAEELVHLPGIGPVLAQRIVDQRTSQGPFQTVDDLSDVKGIGKKRLDQLRPLVMVDMAGQAAKKTRQKAKKL